MTVDTKTIIDYFLQLLFGDIAKQTRSASCIPRGDNVAFVTMETMESNICDNPLRRYAYGTG